MRHSVLLLLLCATSAFAQTTQPLVQQADLVYLGAFRVPLSTNGPSSFAYGGTGLGYNPANNSLFMTGTDPDPYSAEISIPTVVNSATLSSLNTASFIQAFADPTEGNLGDINPSDGNLQKIGGHLVYNGSLYVTGYSYYDASGTQSASHFVRSLTLSSTSAQGPYAISGVDAPWVNQYMGLIPSEWQTLFGGPALTGGCCLSIISVQSNGPSAVVFDPEDVGVTSPVPGIEVLGYPYGNDLGPGIETDNDLLVSSTRIKGVVFPEGTRSVLFFGRHGQGPYCYGTGEDCSDPAWPYQGTHNYPYVVQVWAYDANDLIDVKDNVIEPYEPVPYATWVLDLPFDDSTDDMMIGGAAYDPATERIYISQLCNDGGSCGPVIHVFEVTAATTVRPEPPTSVVITRVLD